MTVICGGGASAPKPTSPAVSFIVGQALEEIVATTLGVSAPWAAILVFAAGQSIDWNALCATDPPAMPTFNAGDIAHIITAPWNPADAPFQKLVTLIQVAAWYYGCQCTSTVTPAPPGYPSIPAGDPVVNLPIPPAPVASGACLTVSNSYTNDPADATAHDETPLFLSPSGSATVNNSTSGFAITTGYLIPPGATFVNFTVNPNCVPFQSNTGELYAHFHDSTGAYLGFSGIFGNVVGPHSGSFGIPANTVYMVLETQQSSAIHGTTTVQLTLSFFGCTSAKLTTPCCPPDPVLIGMLQQILNNEQSIRTLVTQIQRYSVPFAYIDSTQHIGLTGSGSFAISSLLGMRAQITAQPSGLKTSGGNPTYIYDLGWMSVENGDGLIDEIRLTRTNQVWLSRLFQTGVTFGYFLNPGVTATFTELDAEP